MVNLFSHHSFSLSFDNKNKKEKAIIFRKQLGMPKIIWKQRVIAFIVSTLLIISRFCLIYLATYSVIFVVKYKLFYLSFCHLSSTIQKNNLRNHKKLIILLTYPVLPSLIKFWLPPISIDFNSLIVQFPHEKSTNLKYLLISILLVLLKLSVK